MATDMDFSVCLSYCAMICASYSANLVCNPLCPCEITKDFKCTRAF